MKKYNLSSIIDIGCGSGYKLVTYLGDYETIGIEIPEVHEWLTQKYPNRKWLVSDFTMGKTLSADVIICADVIEHLIDPDDLIAFIKDISFKYLIISTPSRNLLYRLWNWRLLLKCHWRRRYIGPPENPSHIREWSFKEFNKYMSMHFCILRHIIVYETQIVICRPKEILIYNYKIQD
jgi:SAM-dependent methyltransferase